VNRRLAQHGFTRPFQLKEDPKQQDRLATWIEYLNFEYWWLDRYTDTIERLEPHYDKAWQKLVDSKVLRPHETKESVRSLSSLNRQQNEQDRALKAVQRATVKAEQVYTSTQLDPNRLSIPQPERIRRINEAHREFVGAQEKLDSINRRNECIGDFVSDTVALRLAKRDAARHRTLIPWILEQVPLIEAELNQTKARESGSDGTKRTKRRIDSDDNTSQQRAPKKQRLGHIEKQRHEQVSSPVVEEIPINMSPPRATNPLNRQGKVLLPRPPPADSLLQHVPVVFSECSPSRHPARARVYKRSNVSFCNWRIKSKYTKYSLLRATLLVKRHVLLSVPLLGHARLIEIRRLQEIHRSQSDLQILIESENGAPNLVGTARPKLKKLTVHAMIQFQIVVTHHDMMSPE